MLNENIISKYRYDAQGLAEYYLRVHFENQTIKFPINPFQILTDLDIHFVFRNFEKLEGLFMPAMTEQDVDLVIINAKRPITRQRFTAAHELSHYLKDARIANSFICNSDGQKSYIERYADAFASAFLMPKSEITDQINKHSHEEEPLTCDDILTIAEYFGTSFEACYYRISKLFPYLVPDAEIKKKYRPTNTRIKWGLNDVELYSSMFDAWNDMGHAISSDYARQVFKNDYVFNDARIEGINVSREAVSEIVSDLENKTQNSEYCKEGYARYCHIAGHARMYDHIFSSCCLPDFSINEICILNRELYSCFPYPEAGGVYRQANAIIMDSKFETLDWTEIIKAVQELSVEVNGLEDGIHSMTHSEIIKTIARIHHRITVIHPFADGNGRTSRGFMNESLLRYGLVPFFVKIDSKEKYLNALSCADAGKDYSKLYEFFMRSMINAHVELAKGY